MERIKIPTEAETPPEHLSVKQTMNMIKSMLKDCLNLTVSIYAEEDGVIHIDGEYKLWNDNGLWQCYRHSGDNVWSPCYPMGAKTSMDYFGGIIQCMARRQLDTWIITNYLCMA